jgi:hypothetical protein
MRYVIALSTEVALAILLPLAAFARSGPLHLHGPFEHPQTISRAGLPTPSVSPAYLLSACGRGRYRDPNTHQCRGPADVR